MGISYEPGDEIELESPSTKRRFFSRSLSWREQKRLAAAVESPKFADAENDEQIEQAFEMVADYLTRTEPPMDKITADSLQNVLDERQIFELFVAIRRNLTIEQKKS